MTSAEQAEADLEVKPGAGLPAKTGQDQSIKASVPARRRLPPRNRPGRTAADVVERGRRAEPRPSPAEAEPEEVAVGQCRTDGGRRRALVGADRLAADAKPRAVDLQDLARRYGSVLGGRGVNIVKAEIAGKGTFWRVRVPAGSRNEAISLCETTRRPAATASSRSSVEPSAFAQRRGYCPRRLFIPVPLNGRRIGRSGAHQLPENGRICGMTESKAMILGCAGKSLTDDEIRFYRDERPWGFILFARNIGEPAADPRSGRRDARQRRPARRAGLHRPGRRPGAAPAPADRAELSRRRSALGALYRPGPRGRPARRLAAGAAACLRSADASASPPTACRCSTCRSRAPATSSARAPTARIPQTVAALGARRGRRPDVGRRAAGHEAHARPWPRLLRHAFRAADASIRRSASCGGMISRRSRRWPICRWR